MVECKESLEVKKIECEVKTLVTWPTGFQALELCPSSGNEFDCATLDHDPSLEVDLTMSIKQAIDHLESDKGSLDPLLDVALDVVTCSYASGNLYCTAGATRGLEDSVGYKEAEDDILRWIRIFLFYRERNENLIVVLENPCVHLKARCTSCQLWETARACVFVCV